jgi:hypothetical protein
MGCLEEFGDAGNKTAGFTQIPVACKTSMHECDATALESGVASIKGLRICAIVSREPSHGHLGALVPSLNDLDGGADRDSR